MPEDQVIDRVRSFTTSIPHRSINSARTNHFVIDEPVHAGGPGEAITPTESFLAGVSACGALLVESRALADGVPLHRLEVGIEAVRNKATPNVFERVNLHFEMVGPTPAQAQQLVEYYQGR